MTLTLAFGSARDVLEKARRDFQRLNAAANRHSEQEVGDALFDFAVTVFHVKDWLKEQTSAPFQQEEVERFIAQSPSLSAFRDLCTASKHKEISRYNPKTAEVLASASAIVDATLGSTSKPLHKAFVTKIVGKDSSRSEALALAATALADWDNFFRKHGL